MRTWRAVSVIAGLATIASCGGSDGTDSTGGGDGGGGGAVGTVTLGPGIQYVSAHNGTMNPAVDTIVAGSTMTWTWTGSEPHGVRSVGTPSFASSPTHTGSGTYVVTFTDPGTYKYDCSVHGQLMTGTIVVLPSGSPPGSSYDMTANVADPAAGKRITVRVPTEMLADDDGYVSAAAIVGVAGAPSDIVPQAGHLALNPSNPSADRTVRPALTAYLTPELDR